MCLSLIPVEQIALIPIEVPDVEPSRSAPLIDRDLPDFVALIQAELAAAAAAEEERSRVKPSALGAGEVVLTAREMVGLSQRRLASRLGTSQPSIARIESGNRMPTVRTMMRIAEATELELVIGLRRPGADRPVALGALVANVDDGLADYLPMVALSPFDRPQDG